MKDLTLWVIQGDKQCKRKVEELSSEVQITHEISSQARLSSFPPLISSCCSVAAISPMLEMSPALHLHTELDQCGQQHLVSECRGSVIYLCLKHYSREKGENIPLVMMNLLPSHCKMRYLSLARPLPTTETMSTRPESILLLPIQRLCCLKVTLQREKPLEVSQGYLKLLLWYSLRVPSGEMVQSISTLSFETHGCSKQPRKHWRADEVIPLSKIFPATHWERQSSLHQLPSWDRTLHLPLVSLWWCWSLGQFPNKHLEV